MYDESGGSSHEGCATRVAELHGQGERAMRATRTRHRSVSSSSRSVRSRVLVASLVHRLAVAVNPIAAARAATAGWGFVDCAQARVQSARSQRWSGSRPAGGVAVTGNTAAAAARGHGGRAVDARDLVGQEILRQRVQAIGRGLTLSTVDSLRVERRGVGLRARWIGKEASVVASAERAIIVTRVDFAHRTVGGTGAARLHGSTCPAGAVPAIRRGGASTVARTSAASARAATGCAATR